MNLDKEAKLHSSTYIIIWKQVKTYEATHEARSKLQMLSRAYVTLVQLVDGPQLSVRLQSGIVSSC